MTNRRYFMAQVATAGSVLLGSGNLYAQSDSAETAWARIHRTKLLRIGAVAGAAPYYHKDSVSGEWQGFMIDFAKSLAASLGLPAIFSAQAGQIEEMNLVAEQLCVAYPAA